MLIQYRFIRHNEIDSPWLYQMTIPMIVDVDNRFIVPRFYPTVPIFCQEYLPRLSCTSPRALEHFRLASVRTSLDNQVKQQVINVRS